MVTKGRARGARPFPKNSKNNFSKIFLKNIKMSAQNKELKLTSGATAEILPFKGKTVFEAQKRIADTGEDFMKVLISMTTKINGSPIVIEELDEMPGMDVIELLGEFSGANFRQSN